MMEYFLFAIIIILLGYILYKDKRYEEHIKDLENKMVGSNQVVIGQAREKKAPPASNDMAKQDREEIPLTEIPMMEFDNRDFNIQMEGDATTPEEARAMKK